jgi:rhodanese-related sulfurtransferase
LTGEAADIPVTGIAWLYFIHMKQVCILVLMAWLLPALALQAQTLTRDPAYQQLLEKMYRKSVPLIPVAEAARLHAGHQQVLFLDTREQEEYQVSHIKNAVWVGYRDFSLQRVAGIPKQTPLVVYCSVGYRSERVGEKLLQAGFTRVHNVYGSLFEWVNQGYPVFTDQTKETTRVHAYSRSWGKWLMQGTKVY